MIAALARIILTFSGPGNQTRCFAHILNLVVKIILCQFDSRTGRAGDVGDLSGLSDELEDLEREEFVMDTNEGDEEDNDVDGLDEVALALGEGLAESLVQPIRKMLTKVTVS